MILLSISSKKLIAIAKMSYAPFGIQRSKLSIAKLHFVKASKHIII
jgi:hypothetical protein